MPRVQQPVTTLNRAAAVAVPTEQNGDPTNGHYYANAPGVFLQVRNAHATNPYNVTVQFARAVDGQTVAAKVYAIPAVSTRNLGPFPVELYGSKVNFDAENSNLKIIAYNPTS